MNTLLLDIAVVLAEVLLIVLLFVALNGILRATLKQANNLPILRTRESAVDTIRQQVKKTLIALCLLLSVVVLAFNGYLFYRQTGIANYMRDRASRITTDSWIDLGGDLGKIAGVVILAGLVARWIRRLLLHLQERAKAYEHIKANDESIEAFFTALTRVQKNTIWLLTTIFAVNTLSVPALVSSLLFVVLRVYLIIAVGFLVVKAVTASVKSLDALRDKYHDRPGFLMWYYQLRGLIPVLTRCLEYIVYAVVATLVILQIDFISQFAAYGPRVAQVIGIFFLARVLVAIADYIVQRMALGEDELESHTLRKRRTIVPVLETLLRIVIFFAAFVLMLKALQINPTPILAGAGILGLAVGLGAQTLINDFVSGFFILSDNLFLVGDYIETGDAKGIVEGIEIRTTRIRNEDGQLHILRNGQIGAIANFSNKYALAVVEVGVAYDSDLEKVYGVLHEIGERFEKQNEYVVQPTRVDGMEDFGESQLLIRTITRVKPGHHREAARDLRKMIKEEFDRTGIEIPFTRRVLIFDKDRNEQE